MTKLDKVKKALQLCRYDPDPGQECKFLVSCDICPYWHDEHGCRWTDLLNDTLELLKEREPVKPKEVKLWYTEYACGYCDYKSVGRKDGYKMRFCPCCGRAVKWDDEA